MAIGIGISPVFNKGGGISWSSYWSQQPEVLFFGLYSEISGGQMPNKVAGATDYLTVAGSAGSETYQAPNTAPYIAADTDYIWFKTDGTRRTTTTAELIGYDLQRTPVRYDDTSPNILRWICILSASIIGDKLDKLHESFHLPIYWSGFWNDYGYAKNNRLANQVLYDYGEAETVALIARMNAVWETPTASRKKIINNVFCGLKTYSLLTKFDAIWLTASHGTLSARLNWIQDAYNLTATTLPTFEIDRGFTGDGSSMFLITGFIPSENGINYLKDSAAFGVYTRVNVDESKCIMGMRDAASTYSTYIFLRDGNKSYLTLQSVAANVTPANTDGRGLFIGSRNASNSQNIYVRGGKTSNTSASVKLETEQFYILAFNAGGSRLFPSSNQVAFAFISSKLTDADVVNLNTVIVDGYLNSIGAKI